MIFLLSMKNHETYLSINIFQFFNKCMLIVVHLQNVGVKR